MNSTIESELRALVRELVAEVLPELPSRAEVRPVHIATDADLARLVTTLVHLVSDQRVLERLASGQLRFTLANRPAVDVIDGDDSGASESAGPSSAVRSQSVLQVDKGAVTERVIAQAVAQGSRIVLGKKAVLTPLAREHARRNNIELERTS
jgi:hypothetical protein